MTKHSHKLYEDVLALVCASICIAVGIYLFKGQGMLTGGTAGLALVASHLTPLNFGAWFFIINLPFYYLGWRQLGLAFTCKTFISVTLVSVLTEFMPQLVTFEHISLWFATIFAGLLVGTGMLIMFRHHASLGGVGILALYLQKRFDIRAGKFQMAVDLSILAVSFFLVNMELLIASVIGAITLNLVIAVNHKNGRYHIT